MSVLIKMTFPSASLLRPVDIVAVLPKNPKDSLASGKVLWALHCAMEDGDFFTRYLNGILIAQHTGLAIIAPSLGNGFFMNTSFEAQADFLEEIYATLPSLFRISAKASENAVIGISMGGFGAMRWALETSHFFAAAAISGAFDANLPVDERVANDKKLNFINLAFDGIMRARLSDASGKLPDNASLKETVKSHSSHWPKLLFYCGTEDYLSLGQTKNFYDFCKAAGAPASLTLEHGSHNLEFWKEAFPRAVKDIFQLPQLP